jgi:hypothetical protein
VNKTSYFQFALLFLILFCFYNTRHTQIYSYQNIEVKRPSITRNLGARRKWHKIYLILTQWLLSVPHDEGNTSTDDLGTFQSTLGDHSPFQFIYVLVFISQLYFKFLTILDFKVQEIILMLINVTFKRRIFIENKIPKLKLDPISKTWKL